MCCINIHLTVNPLKLISYLLSEYNVQQNVFFSEQYVLMCLTFRTCMEPIQSLICLLLQII